METSDRPEPDVEKEGGVLPGLERGAEGRAARIRGDRPASLQHVGTLLAQTYPELAKELNGFVDTAVGKLKDGINAIAAGLQKDVNDLLEGLREGALHLLQTFRGATEGLGALTRAVVAGDWAQAGLLLFEQALSLVGVDKAKFYAFIGKAKDTLVQIVKDPGAFLGHLEDAVKDGFGQFGANFLEHLNSGVLQWLFGAIAETGITLPEKFDLAGVFDIVLQVLGLTKAALRKVAVRVIGEENVEKIEYVWNFLVEATANGLSGLWERAKEFLGGLWDLVVGEAQNWALVQLVQKAVVKLATLWNPAGALVQVVLTAWDLFQWVLENARRMKGLVDTVTQTMPSVVIGAVKKAANWVEGGLAKVVPMVVSFFADLLGLGGIGKEVRTIVEKAGTFVAQAVEKLVRKVAGLFHRGLARQNTTTDPEESRSNDVRAEIQRESALDQAPEQRGSADAASGLREVENPIAFQAANHGHRLWMAETGEQAELFVASEPMTVLAMLDRMAQDKDSWTAAEGSPHLKVLENKAG